MAEYQITKAKWRIYASVNWDNISSGCPFCPKPLSELNWFLVKLWDHTSAKFSSKLHSRKLVWKFPSAKSAVILSSSICWGSRTGRVELNLSAPPPITESLRKCSAMYLTSFCICSTTAQDSIYPCGFICLMVPNINAGWRCEWIAFICVSKYVTWIIAAWHFVPIVTHQWY